MSTTKGSLGHFGTRQGVTLRHWDSIIGHSSKNIRSHRICRWSRIDTFVTFSLGFVVGHWLEISQGRYSKTPRDLRCCPNCTSVVEDEQHFLLECPIYNDLRQRFSSLFREDRRTLIDVFRPDQDFTKLARFMTICWERRLQLNRRSNESYGLCGPQGL